MTRVHRLAALAIACGSLALAACGGGGNDAEPRLIPSGGVGDGAIDGKLNVYVIDGDTDEPVAGAAVLVGEPSETPLEGTTDSTGLITFNGDGLDGATTVTVNASGYVVSSWMGVNGANITIPLESTTASSVPQAEMRGTITGWDGLTVAQNHILVGVVNYSHTTELGDAANEIETPNLGGGGGMGGLGPNMCGKFGTTSLCDWRLNVRTGTIALFATIVDVDTKGTTDQNDDTSVVIGFAFKGNIAVEGGVNQSGLELTQVDSASLSNFDLTFATSPAGLTEVGAVVGLDLGDQGVLNLAFVDPDESTTLVVPSLAGEFASGSYRATAFANSATAGENDGPGTAIVKRGITGASVDLGAWMDQPSTLSADAGTFSFTGVSDAALHSAEFRDSSGTKVWDIALFDGRTSFTLPGLSPNPLPSGAATLQVNAIDGDVDLTDFVLDDFFDTFGRLSSNNLDFTN